MAVSNPRSEYALTPDGCRLWTATAGSGAPLLLCHGGPGLWDYLEPVPAMIEDVATVHRYDQRGGGHGLEAGASRSKPAVAHA